MALRPEEDFSPQEIALAYDLLQLSKKVNQAFNMLLNIAHGNDLFGKSESHEKMQFFLLSFNEEVGRTLEVMGIPTGQGEHKD